MEAHWQLRPSVPSDLDFAVKSLPAVQRQILYGLGLTNAPEIEEFLHPEEVSFDPILFNTMDQVLERLDRAISRKQPIVVYGDYDADGVLATALLVRALRSAGAVASHYIPDRLTEGYGLNVTALASLKANGAELIVTVDNGIRSVTEGAWCDQNGIDLIITDHHQPGERIPSAIGVINPNQRDDRYPFKDLAGVGLAYKLAKALESRFPQIEADQYVDMVAIGTIADLAPLRGENRALTMTGLKAMANSRNVGLVRLAQVAGVNPAALTSNDIGFRIAPRLNAAGRLKSAELACELLLVEDSNKALELAQELDSLNSQRQKQTEKEVRLAFDKLGALDTSDSIVIMLDEGFHEGLIGLIASRISKEFYRPSVVATETDGRVKASARSIEEFHITEALESMGELFERYGGHAAAAGFTATIDNWNAIQERLRDQATTQFDMETWQPKIYVDYKIEAAELGNDLLDFLDTLEPFGMKNLPPIFVLESAEVLGARRVGSGGDHLKLTVRKDGRVFDAIAFRLGARLDDLGREVDIAFHFERNNFRGVISPQLSVIDLK